MNKLPIIRSPRTTEEFEKYFKVRYLTLRKPWGQPEGSERDEQDNDTIHAAAFIGEEIVGVGRLQKNDETTGQIRYMGVLEGYRSGGIGALLLTHLEEKAREAGLKKVILQARDKALEFYQRNGYKVEEKTFLMFDSIQHYLMEKQL